MTKQTKLWTCKDGRKVRICDMTDQHLLNTIRMILRAAPRQQQAALESAQSCAAMIHGEMASMSIESEIDRLIEMSAEEFAEVHCPLLYELCEDAMRRKLEVPHLELV